MDTAQGSCRNRLNFRNEPGRQTLGNEKPRPIQPGLFRFREHWQQGSSAIHKQSEQQDSLSQDVYRQDWSAYDAAQKYEKKEFLLVLDDLCAGIEEPERKPDRGRSGRGTSP
jgi:hypothetical protein